MPIRPEMKALYPANWKEIRASILLRADNRCEKCRRPNHHKVIVHNSGEWISILGSLLAKVNCFDGILFSTRDNNGLPALVALPDAWSGTGCHVTKTILTISHQDHDPTNNDPSNLRALCQRCHLTHDAKEHAHNARKTRARKAGQCELKGVET